MAFINLVLTTDGMALYAKAQQGKTLHFTRVALGDGLLGSGSLVNRSALISERMSMLIDAIQLVEDGISAAVTATLDNQGMSQGFYSRELGLFAEDPDTHQEKLYLYSHAGSDGEYIPDGNSGTLVYERLKLMIKLENTGSVTFSGSGNPLYLSAEDVEPIIQAYVGDMDVKTAGGTATALTVTLSKVTAYRTGMKLTIIAGSNNEGAATTLKVNSLAAKPIYKANTTTAPTLKAGKPYTLILSSDLSHFFIEASAEGDAVAANVLAGKTFSNDDDTGLIGTMVNNGSVGTVNLTAEGAEYTIPAGYHNGLGKVKSVITGLIASAIKAGTTVGGILGTFTSDATATAAQILFGQTAYVNGNKITGTIASKGAQTYTPGTANQTISAGQYLSGAQTIAGDADLIAGNIKSGVNIFGITGNYEMPSTISPGDNILVSADTERDSDSDSAPTTMYTKYKEILVKSSGTIRVKYDFKGGSETRPTYGRVYKNGVAVGVERSSIDYVNYVSYAEDITVNTGDLIQFYMKGTFASGGISLAYVRNFKLCTSLPYPAFVINLN